MTSNGRVFLGLAAQPFVAAAAAFAGFRVFLLDATGRSLAGGFPTNSTDAATSVAVGAAVVTLVVTLFGVWPLVQWLRQREQLTLPIALVAGMAFANFPIVLGTILTHGGYGPDGALRGIAFASTIGLAGAIAFWLIAIRRATD